MKRRTETHWAQVAEGWAQLSQRPPACDAHEGCGESIICSAASPEQAQNICQRDTARHLLVLLRRVDEHARTLSSVRARPPWARKILPVFLSKLPTTHRASMHPLWTKLPIPPPLRARVVLSLTQQPKVQSLPLLAAAAARAPPDTFRPALG